MSRISQRDPRLDFGNLPLIEAACRVSLESPIEMTFGIVNALHESLRNEFPVLTEPDQFEVGPGITQTAQIRPGFISGAVYRGNRRGLVLTVQKNVIVARWFEQVDKDSSEYPRYDALCDALWRTYDAFSKTCNRTLPVVVVNMSYVNFLDIPYAADVLRKYFSESAHIKATDDAQEIHKIEASWRKSDLTDLRFSIEKGTMTDTETPVSGYKLTTVAARRVVGAPEPRDELDNVHRCLQYFFRELISEHAKKQWKLENGRDG